MTVSHIGQISQKASHSHIVALKFDILIGKHGSVEIVNEVLGPHHPSVVEAIVSICTQCKH